MGLKKDWTYKGKTLRGSYHRVVALKLICVDRSNPVLVITLALYADLESRNGERWPMRDSWGEINVTYSRDGIQWDDPGSPGDSIQIHGEADRAAIEAHIAAQVPLVYGALMDLPLYEGAKVE